MKTADRLDQPEVPAKDAQTAGTDFFSSSPVLFPACRTSGAGKAFVTREQIRLARKADLHGFLLEKHPGLFRSSGCSIYMRCRDSLYIREGFPGYTDFSSGSHGNPIDFLTGSLGYGIVDAVMALTGGASCRRPPASPQEEHAAPHPIPLPESAEKPYRRVYAYLLGRGIPPGMTRILEQRSLLYQERDHGNAVFVNPERDFCEMRGTLTYSSRPFHGCLKTKPDRFWYLLSTDKIPETAFLCEGTIDAISLFLLHLKAGMRKPAVYIGIGGVSNQKTIERVKSHMHAVLAVDNDRAGDLCRERNHDMESLIPADKGWNEDLQALRPLSGYPPLRTL